MCVNKTSMIFESQVANIPRPYIHTLPKGWTSYFLGRREREGGGGYGWRSGFGQIQKQKFVQSCWSRKRLGWQKAQRAPPPPHHHHFKNKMVRSQRISCFQRIIVLQCFHLSTTKTNIKENVQQRGVVLRSLLHILSQIRATKERKEKKRKRTHKTLRNKQHRRKGQLRKLLF